MVRRSLRRKASRDCARRSRLLHLLRYRRDLRDPGRPFHERAAGRQGFAPVRGQVKIAMKFGIRFDTSSGIIPYPLVMGLLACTHPGIRGRLPEAPRTDHIDLYYQHRVDPATEPDVVASMMADLMKEGRSSTGTSRRSMRTTSGAPMLYVRSPRSRTAIR
jgi:hypothetical protein